MTSKQELIIAVAGAGLVGRRHISAIERIDGLRVGAIVDPSEEAATLGKNSNVPVFQSLESYFDTHQPDGVVLSTPTPLHVEQGMLCLARGCPTLVEKPIAVSARNALAMVELSEKTDVPLLVGHHRRHNPLIQKAQQAIASGAIGDVRAISVNCWFYKPDHYFAVAPWRKARGAGPISVNLVHDVDLIRYLCGDIVSVQAQAEPSRRGFENEDVAAAIVRFKSGAIGTITVSDSTVSPWSWEFTSGEYPIYPKTEESCYQIGGSKGALSIPDLKLWHHEASPDWWTPIAHAKEAFAGSDPLVNQMLHFAAVIERKQQPLVSGREGLKTLEVIEAIQIAAREGTTVIPGRTKQATAKMADS